jgi:hypothetical protein
MQEKIIGRKLYTEMLNNLYCSPNIITLIKLRGMTSMDHVACMIDVRNT